MLASHGERSANSVAIVGLAVYFVVPSGISLYFAQIFETIRKLSFLFHDERNHTNITLIYPCLRSTGILVSTSHHSSSVYALKAGSTGFLKRHSNALSPMDIAATCLRDVVVVVQKLCLRLRDRNVLPASQLSQLYKLFEHHIAHPLREAVHIGRRKVVGGYSRKNCMEGQSAA